MRSFYYAFSRLNFAKTLKLDHNIPYLFLTSIDSPDGDGCRVTCPCATMSAARFSL